MFLVAVVSAAMLVALVVFGLSMLAFPKGTPNPFPDISHLGWTAGTEQPRWETWLWAYF